VATLYADPQLARKVLGWKAKRNLADMCTDAWRWQSSHPEGYAGSSARPVKKNPG
jgi:UDP-glucose 4-epimerase